VTNLTADQTAVNTTPADDPSAALLHIPADPSADEASGTIPDEAWDAMADEAAALDAYERGFVFA
jgi:hypothetical protein